MTPYHLSVPLIPSVPTRSNIDTTPAVEVGIRPNLLLPLLPPLQETSLLLLLYRSKTQPTKR